MGQVLWFGFFMWVSTACSFSTAEGDGKMIPIGPLPDELTENSGLLMIGPDTYVGHNDSGNEPYLYQFSMKRKSGVRAIKVNNATNVDWEELAMDDTYIYIGDTGNNAGNRKDLCIYRVSLDDVKKKSEVTAEKISYIYPEQKSFKGSKKHNFDCEAMVVVGDSLFLFTKNRGDQRTEVYGILKTATEHVAKLRGSFDAQGLITGADYRNKYGANELVLVGYKTAKNNYSPFLIHFTDVRDNAFFNSPFTRLDFPGSVQIESVIFHDYLTIYMANEEEHGDPGLIWKVDISK